MRKKQRTINNTGLAAALAVLAAEPASAIVLVGGDRGFEISFDGNVNGFGVYIEGDELPPTAAGSGGLLLISEQDGFRVTTGYLPATFGFNVKAPTWKGLDMGARIGFYPQIQNANAKNQFGVLGETPGRGQVGILDTGIQAGAQIDLREAFFTVDGDVGQALVGRKIGIYQGTNVLRDMTLYGVGITPGVAFGTPTIGRIGIGYLYSNFNATIQYTTPDISGFKLTAGIADPSVIAGDGVVASETDSPRFEGELSYGKTFTDATVFAWFNGMVQNANFVTGNNPACEALGGCRGDVTASGLGWGASVGYKQFELQASGFLGYGAGTALQLDTDSLDFTGDTRDADGYLFQGTYTFPNRLGDTKLGLQYGQTNIDRTAAESAGNINVLKERTAWTVGVYHDLNEWLKLIAEYTNFEQEWFDGSNQTTNIVGVGAMFRW